MRFKSLMPLAAVLAAAISAGCATTPASPYDKPGFVTKEDHGRLWVFREDSKDWETFQQHGEPVKQVTKIGVGPKGMTVKSSDGKVIDEYLKAAK
jgi:hypothetical protein